MKTIGEIEAAISDGIRKFELEYMGRGPKDVHTFLLGDLIVVRLVEVMTAAEKHMVKNVSADRGRDLIKQVRTHLIETARLKLEHMIESITDVKVVSLHHDISTSSGEEIIVFTLIEKPTYREAKR